MKVTFYRGDQKGMPNVYRDHQIQKPFSEKCLIEQVIVGVRGRRDGVYVVGQWVLMIIYLDVTHRIGAVVFNKISIWDVY